MMEKLRVFTAFSGYDSQCMALDRLGMDYELVGWSEIDKYAIQAHNAVYPQWKDRNYGDISKIDWGSVPDFELFTYSFPCGLAGTQIITSNGYKNIEDVMVDDMVLTHENRFNKVLRTMSRISNHHYTIKAIGCSLRLTENHPMYVLRDGKEQWVKVKDLKKDDKLSYCIPERESAVNLSDEYLWLLGRYVADGFINSHLYNSVEFAIGNDKEQEFLDNIPLDLKDRFRTFKKSCVEYRIADAELQEYCNQFGRGSMNKRIPQWVIDLPKHQAECFLKGYLAGDGFLRYRKGTPQWMFCTVSKQLFLGIQRLMMKVYGRVCSLYIRKDKRKPTFNDTYNGQLNITESKKQITIGNRIFVSINSIERIDGDVQVYNMEVEEDNSYTCDNVNVHNCQDISNAGVQRGLEEGSGTRSSLLWECCKAIEAKRPKYLLMENVKALTSKKFLPYLHKWEQYLFDLGYSNSIKVLNAKDFGVPQNRERVFMVSILGDETYHFPKGFPLDKRLKDVLEKNVDEKYYLNPKMIRYILDMDNVQSGTKWEGRADNDVLSPDIAHTISSRGAGGYQRAGVSNFIVDGEENIKVKELKDKMTSSIPLNPYPDGTCRTIKAQYSCNNMRNFIRKDGFGATGVIEVNAEPSVLTPKRTEYGKSVRKDYEAGSIKESRHNMTEMVPRDDGVSNTLTTVQKDNLVIEPKIIQVGNIVSTGNWDNPQRGRIYSSEGICPALNTVGGGGLEPKIAQPICINPKVNGKQPSLADRVYDEEGISTAITVGFHPPIFTREPSFRIRKLTERECFRLMGVSEENIDKIQAAGISKTQQYKMAGNSIVVDVLCHIFRKLFIDNNADVGDQLSLF